MPGRPYHPPSPSTIAKFNDTPWAAAMFSDPNLIPFLNGAPVKSEKKGRGGLFMSTTLNNDDTISAWQSFYKQDDEKGRLEAISVMKIGKGLNGHVDICHGGFVGVLLDEVISSAVDCEVEEGVGLMTAFLKVDYKKPVPTPSTVLCRSWVERKEGRKVWGKGTVEDGMGTVFALGEALFIGIEGRKVGRGVKL